MIIGIDASRANATQKTGTEWYAFHVIEELKQLIPGDYTVVLYSKEPLTGSLSQLPPHWSSKVLAWKPRFLWTQMRLSLEMLFHAPDLLYVPTHTLPLITPKKSVTVIHDVGFAHQNQLYNNATLGSSSSLGKRLVSTAVWLLTLGKYTATEQDYHRFAVEHAKKKALSIITVSNFSRDEMVRLYDIDPASVHVIHNGYNTRTSNNTQSQSVQKPYLLYTGRLEHKKNTPRLIDAFAILKKKHAYTGKLVLAGSPGFGIQEVHKRITHHALENSVIEAGWVSEDELTRLMRDADAFIFPSLYEGFGIPVLEAMNAGTAVVCSDIPPLREVAEDAAEFFAPESADAMAASLNHVLHDSAYREGLISKGHQRSKHFSWQKTAEKTWAVLKPYCESSAS